MTRILNGHKKEFPGGWGQYSDDQYITSSRFSIVADTRTKIPNNAGVVNETFFPVGLSSIYNGTSQKLTPSVVGDTFMLRVNFEIASASANNFATFELDIGGALGVILSKVLFFPKGTADHTFSTSIFIFTLGTFVANGGELYITPDVNTDMWDISYVIGRISSS